MLRYPSIENHFNVNKSKKIMAWINETFYATEKIHGSNLQIKLTPDDITYFSRNRELDSDDPFYTRLIGASNTHKIIDITKKYMQDNSLNSILNQFYLGKIGDTPADMTDFEEDYPRVSANLKK